jgi:phosphoribosylamine--glycine ligase
MRILVLDHSAFLLDWVIRAQEAGHSVKWYVPQNPKTCFIGKGMVERINDWRKYLLWADLVVNADNTRYVEILEPYRRQGLKILGATPEFAALELDRTHGQRVFKDHGMPVPDYKQFSDYDSAIAYVKKQDRAFCSKPLGDESDKSLTYVAKTPEDLIYMLLRWKKAKKHKAPFILQEKVSGIEMAVGGFIGPHGFNEGWTENFEEKSLFAGGLGQNTGEMGTTLRVVKKSKLADKVLKPLEEMLVRIGAVGYCDINTIIDEKGTPYPLEFTCRFGYPCINIQLALNEGDPVQWLLDLYDGKDAKNFRMDEIAVGAIVAIPDFPMSLLTRKDVYGIPIWIKGDTENLHFCEVQMGTAPTSVNGKIVDMPCHQTAGDYVLVSTGTGDVVRDARRRCYAQIDKLKIPNSPFWRIDIGQRLARQLPELHALGYANGMEY